MGVGMSLGLLLTCVHAPEFRPQNSLALSFLFLSLSFQDLFLNGLKTLITMHFS